MMDAESTSGQNDQVDKIIRERDWLVAMLTDPGRVNVTDTGFDFTQKAGEIAYEVPYGRFEILIRAL